MIATSKTREHLDGISLNFDLTLQMGIPIESYQNTRFPTLLRYSGVSTVMQKKSKSDIKKMIAELHAKPKAGEAAKNEQVEQAAGAKNSKSAQVNKTYRPKI